MSQLQIIKHFPEVGRPFSGPHIFSDENFEKMNDFVPTLILWSIQLASGCDMVAQAVAANNRDIATVSNDNIFVENPK